MQTMNSFLIQDDFVRELDKKIAKKLDKKRYQHTLGVAYTAASLAMAYGLNCHTAYLAGLLHDNAKGISTEKKLSLCKKFKIEINDSESANPDLLHAKLGAYYAEHKYEIKDKAILQAITCHTTGKPAMTSLEKILYIADYIEPGRKPLQDIDLIRQIAFSDLDRCMELILRNTLHYLEQKGAVLDPMTLETYEYYKEAAHHAS